MKLNRMSKKQLLDAHRRSVESGQHQLVVRDRVIMDEEFSAEELSMIRFVNCVLSGCTFTRCDARGWELEGTEVHSVVFRDSGVSMSSFDPRHDVLFESLPAEVEPAVARERRIIVGRRYVGLRLTGADLANYEFRDCSFIDCVLRDCDLTNVHLVGCRLERVWLVNSRVSAGTFAPGPDVHILRIFRAQMN